MDPKSYLTPKIQFFRKIALARLSPQACCSLPSSPRGARPSTPSLPHSTVTPRTPLLSSGRRALCLESVAKAAV
ncbi:hypothetical protein C2S53_000661 [Perilla frutescens var. hirtella]|uniref:Uncharacterized protein n=1 Tax=Perilla frutescens var. hirtella TaxID=608512 RepID=A0AAD4P355_PERFH|nr:hypothetical protein C2S53_000661 [Perilla frutescens var. hirtella]